MVTMAEKTKLHISARGNLQDSGIIDGVVTFTFENEEEENFNFSIRDVEYGGANFLIRLTNAREDEIINRSGVITEDEMRAFPTEEITLMSSLSLPLVNLESSFKGEDGKIALEVGLAVAERMGQTVDPKEIQGSTQGEFQICSIAKGKLKKALLLAK